MDSIRHHSFFEIKIYIARYLYSKSSLQKGHAGTEAYHSKPIVLHRGLTRQIGVGEIEKLRETNEI